jgi:dipicolinate synthase subunit A
MKKYLDFILIGGDIRMGFLRRFLRADGHGAVWLCAREGDSACDPSFDYTPDCIILPVPLASGGMLNAPLADCAVSLESLFTLLPYDVPILAGIVPDSIAALTAGHKVVDYYERDDFSLLNAVPTAEGAIASAVLATPYTMYRRQALVTGFGRVGKVLAQRLDAFGCHVTVVARRNDERTLARVLGFEAADFSELGEAAGNADLIFNTVPAQVFGYDELKYIGAECLFMDFASLPGGVDMTAARRLGVDIRREPSLPGRTAPWSAAEAMRDTAYTILKEEGLYGG